MADAFDLGAKVVDVHAYGNGLINDTYLVTTARSEERVILQRLNPRVFAEPQRLMANLRLVLAHIRRRQEQSPRRRDLRFPYLYRTNKGGEFLFDDEGALWRAMSYLAETRAYDRLADTAQAAEVGFALGRFHELVRDLDPSLLHEARPYFHDTPRYYAKLDQTVAAAGRRLRSPAVQEALDFVEARRANAGALESAKASGLLTARTVHGDPKLNNFLFDQRSGKAVSLIDLDTVTPGLIHYDIGDCVRSCCNTAGESPAGDHTVNFDLAACRSVLENYLSQTGANLTEEDRRHLYDAIRLIPLELGIRFLTDYLDGDRYFKIEHPEHNLVRALTQFKLSACIESAEHALQTMIDGLTAT